MFSINLSDSLQDLFGVAGVESVDPEASQFNILYPDIIMASKLFPFEVASKHKGESWRDLAHHLPPYERAKYLVDRYHFTMDRQILPVPPSQTDDALLPQFYPSDEAIDDMALRKDALHDLAVLFAVFATGCSEDESLPQFNPEAEWYAHLSRAALSFHNVLDHASLSSVQAILVLASYIRSVGKSKRSDLAWNHMTFGFQISTSVSIYACLPIEDAEKFSIVHRSVFVRLRLHQRVESLNFVKDHDPSRWVFDEYSSNLRRKVFWESFAADKWHSLSLGRPPYFPKEAVSCELPVDDGRVERGMIHSLWLRNVTYDTRMASINLALSLCTGHPS